MSETSEGVEAAVEHDDVLEALKWFRRKAERVPVGGVPMPDRLIEEREQVVTRYLSQKEETIRHLRERLEEVEEDAARYADSNMRLNESYNRLSRRSEKLEGALRTVLNEHRIAEDWSLPKRLEEYLTSALATLDSREDEGDRRCALCNHPISDHPIRAGDSGRIEICTHPVHADQPERGDCPHCSYRGNPDPESPVDEFVHDVDCPNRNPNAGPGDEPEEGDSVWHNRAADECRCGHARCNHVRDATTTTRRCGMKGCDCDDFMPTDEPVSGEGEDVHNPCENHPNREGVGRTEDGVWLCWECVPTTDESVHFGGGKRERVFPPITRGLVDCFYDRTESYTGCYDCGRQYGGAYGFPDLIVPDEVWKRISPTGDQGGLLCPSCIVKRCAQEGISCEAEWKSGPFVPTHADARSELPSAYYRMAAKAIEAKADEGWYRNEFFARQVAHAFRQRLSTRPDTPTEGPDDR